MLVQALLAELSSFPMRRCAAIAACLLLSACATTRGSDPVLLLGGDDDEAGAMALASFLRDAGQPVEMSSDGFGVFVYQRGMATLLSPVLQTEGLDRVVATRIYGPAAGHGDADLTHLAASLNDQLNVGAFAVDQGALVFQSHATFIDRLAEAEVLAFLAWLDQAELAIARVDAASGTLLLTTSR